MTLMEWAEAEKPRVGRQVDAVRRVMTSDHAWYTFDALRKALAADGIYVSEAGVSARIRDLRKKPLCLTVDSIKTERRGIFAYRVRA